jgi:hypothetical protein
MGHADPQLSHVKAILCLINIVDVYEEIVEIDLALLKAEKDI